MALAQKRVPYAFQRPATRARALYPRHAAALRPAVVRPRAKIALPSLSVSLKAGAATVVLAIAYIGGYAKMTGVNYRKVRIQQAASALLTQQQLLHSEIILRTDKRAIAAWAESHGMELAGSQCVVLHDSAGLPGPINAACAASLTANAAQAHGSKRAGG